MAKLYLPAVIWTALLITLCLLPRGMTPERDSGGPALKIPHLDKVAHAGLFGGFGLFWTRAAASTTRLRTIFVLGVMLAVGTELAQALPIVARDPDVLDALADVVGLCAGMSVPRFLPVLSTT